MFELDGITEAGRAFVFKLSLCNPFARSAGIFYALLRAFTQFTVLSSLLSLLRLQFKCKLHYARAFSRFYLS